MPPSTPRKAPVGGIHSTPRIRNRVAVLFKNGFSAKEIAIAEEIPVRRVYGIASRYDKQDQGFSLPKKARPSILSESDRAYLKLQVHRFPFISIRELRA